MDAPGCKGCWEHVRLSPGGREARDEEKPQMWTGFRTRDQKAGVSFRGLLFKDEAARQRPRPPGVGESLLLRTLPHQRLSPDGKRPVAGATSPSGSRAPRLGPRSRQQREHWVVSEPVTATEPSPLCQPARVCWAPTGRPDLWGARRRIQERGWARVPTPAVDRPGVRDRGDGLLSSQERPVCPGRWELPVARPPSATRNQKETAELQADTREGASGPDSEGRLPGLGRGVSSRRVCVACLPQRATIWEALPPLCAPPHLLCCTE